MKRLINIIMPFHNLEDMTMDAVQYMIHYTKAPVNLCLVDNNSHEKFHILEKIIQVCEDYTKKTDFGFMYVRNEKNHTYAESCNIGYKALKDSGLESDKVVFCNNDILFTNGWELDFLNAEKRINSPGILGPVTNRISGPQQLSIPKGWELPKDVPQYAKFLKKNHYNIIRTFPSIKGFFLWIKTDVFEDIGFFDEQFENAYDEEDLCIRSVENGYTNAIVGDCFIYHHCSQTIKKKKINYDEKMAENKKKLIKKHGFHKISKIFSDYGVNLEGV